MQEVGGSSPPGSTSPGSTPTVGAHEFREHFGWYMERAAAGEEISVTRHGKPTVRLVRGSPAPQPAVTEAPNDPSALRNVTGGVVGGCPVV